MIDQETFYKEVMQNFRDINAKLDKTQDGITDLCVRQTQVETRIEDATTFKKEADNKKYNRMMAIIAAVGAFTGISEIWNLAHSAK